MSQSRLLPSWPPLALCRCGSEQNTSYRADGLGYYCGKKADGFFKGWKSEPLLPQRRHEIRPGESIMGRREKYPYADWFDGEPHILEQGADFDSNPAAMLGMIRSAARTRHMTIHLQRRGPQISVQAEATRAA